MTVILKFIRHVAAQKNNDNLKHNHSKKN